MHSILTTLPLPAGLSVTVAVPLPLTVTALPAGFDEKSTVKRAASAATHMRRKVKKDRICFMDGCKMLTILGLRMAQRYKRTQPKPHPFTLKCVKNFVYVTFRFAFWYIGESVTSAMYHLTSFNPAVSASIWESGTE